MSTKSYFDFEEVNFARFAAKNITFPAGIKFAHKWIQLLSLHGAVSAKIIFNLPFEKGMVTVS